MPVLLGIDTGGTYTDAVLYDDTRGVIASAKALTTKHDLSSGIRQALEAVLKSGYPKIGLVSLSTTLATNAIVEGQGSPICLLLLGYPPDALELAGLGKALGSDPVVFINGGHMISGDEQMPLDMDAALRAISENTPKVAAFAVSGYFSVHNPAHELAVRELIHRHSGLPVTCGHELTSHLHAPRRALTAALNARLIPFLQQLILSVKATLLEKNILAPLMVVKGDGSLIEAQVALERPVETILSGPAASVVGALHLSGEGDVLVADMGGTTTDIALLEGGKPELSKDGAIVGGWHTMVEAIAVHTSGLGGDSEVRLDEKEGLVVGPQRVVPLSLLAFQHPECLEKLRQQAINGIFAPFSGRFVLHQRPLDNGEVGLDTDEREVWDKLACNPLAVDTLLADKAKGLWWQRAINRLVSRGLVILSAFTPTDAAHVLGYQSTWSIEAARLGAELWVRRISQPASVDELTMRSFCQQVIHQVTIQLGRALVAAAISPEDEINLTRPSPMRRLFIDRALKDGRPEGLVDVALTLKRPLVAVGAPAETYFPHVAERLHTKLVTPPYAEVANAVGAVVGSVVQTVRATIRKLPGEQGYRIHLPTGVQDFDELEEAASFTAQKVARLAEGQALRAGASNPQVQVRRHDQVYSLEDHASEEIYLGTEVTATAVGRPRMGR
jgi:N-methylhydantoinase A/oxoprolinase/acetone carboxylase beta subunit